MCKFFVLGIVTYYYAHEHQQQTCVMAIVSILGGLHARKLV